MCKRFPIRFDPVEGLFRKHSKRRTLACLGRVQPTFHHFGFLARQFFFATVRETCPKEPVYR